MSFLVVFVFSTREPTIKHLELLFRTILKQLFFLDRSQYGTTI
jgi:hypothetical protein